MQFLNVAMGGSLIQDIRSEIQHRSVDERSSFHDIEVLPGNRLSTLLGSDQRVRVNSRHHQGVDLPRVAQGVRVTALAADGIVEGLEVEGEQFLVAVQCHPEYLDQVPRLNGLFGLFVTAVRGA